MSQNINTLPKMSPIPGTFEVMTNLDVIRSIHVPSLPGCEVGDVQGFSSNEQDQEENMVDRVPTLKARSRVWGQQVLH